MKIVSLSSEEKLQIVSSVSHLFNSGLCIFLAFVLLLKYAYILLQDCYCLEIILEPNLLCLDILRNVYILAQKKV